MGLKFVVHFGQFVVQGGTGSADLAGPAVILVHRLLKNRIREATGITDYAYYTAAVLNRLATTVALLPHTEAVDEMDDTCGGVDDLAPALAARRAARVVRLTPGEADFSLDFHLPLTPAEAWEWWVNPQRSQRWLSGGTITGVDAVEGGRTRAGTRFHCAHGAGLSVSHYLDWRPFDYVTCERVPIRTSMNTPPHIIDTTEFRGTRDGGTAMTWRLRLLDRGPRARLKLALMRPLLRRGMAGDRRRLLAILAEEGSGGPAATPPA
jgi:hypothetical protein